MRPAAAGRARVAALLAGALAAAGATPARASGFLLYEQSAESLARAGAVTAGTREPAAVWFNPAALVYTPGPAVSLSGTFLRSSTRFSPDAGGSDVRSVPGNNVVPSLFAHAPIGERVAVGLGVLAPFGLTVHWPDGWVGSQHALRTQIYVVTANAVAAYRLHDRVSIAAGASVHRGSVDLLADLEPRVGGRARLRGTTWGAGWNLAVLYRPLPELVQVAATYHSRVHLAFAGDADFSPVNQMIGSFVDQSVKADVTLPDIITLGVMVRPRPRLELGLDVSQVRWSSFDHLTIDFERPGTPDRDLERGSINPFTFRLGAEGWLPRIALALRAGAFFDQSATPAEHLDPFAPDAHRLGLAAGVGYVLGRVKIDLAYAYAHFFAAEAHPTLGASETEAAPSGTYRTRVQALGLTITVR